MRGQIELLLRIGLFVAAGALLKLGVVTSIDQEAGTATVDLDALAQMGSAAALVGLTFWRSRIVKRKGGQT